MQRIKTDKPALRKFGITMGIAFLLIAAIAYFKRGTLNYPILSISLFFFIAGLLLPLLLKPIYIFWMKLALILSWINTRVLLIIIYYLLFTPISLILKLIGKDLIDSKIDRSARSYWKKREEGEFKPSNYERQF